MSSRPRGLLRELLAEALALCRFHDATLIIKDHLFNFETRQMDDILMTSLQSFPPYTCFVPWAVIRGIR